MKGAEGNVLDRGKYVVVWQREQGQWRIHRDIWSTSLTPEAK
jgi:ketosteroid isomerase-like protein